MRILGADDLPELEEGPLGNVVGYEVEPDDPDADGVFVGAYVVGSTHPAVPTDALYFFGCIWPNRMTALTTAVPTWTCEHRHDTMVEAIRCARDEEARA